MSTIPTIGFNVETVTYKNIKFQVWDLGGQTSIRPYWRCYYPNTQARQESRVSDKSCLSSQKNERLHSALPSEASDRLPPWNRPPPAPTSLSLDTRAPLLLRLRQAIIYVVDSSDVDRIGTSKLEFHAILEEEELKDAVILVFANKQDLPGALSEAQVTEGLGLHQIKTRTWSIFKTSAVKGEGCAREKRTKKNMRQLMTVLAPPRLAGKLCGCYAATSQATQLTDRLVPSSLRAGCGKGWTG